LDLEIPECIAFPEITVNILNLMKKGNKLGMQIKIKPICLWDGKELNIGEYAK